METLSPSQMASRTRQAVLLGLAEALIRQGSRTGETHLQKAIYVLQTLARVPLRYEFIPYRHGPFSFELRDDLASLRADALLEVTPRRDHVQAIQGPTERGLRLWHASPAVTTWAGPVEWTARTVGKRGVAELERLSTALFVSVRGDELHTATDRAHQIRTMKPHISEDEAHDALAVIDAMIVEAATLFAG